VSLVPLKSERPLPDRWSLAHSCCLVAQRTQPGSKTSTILLIVSPFPVLTLFPRLHLLCLCFLIRTSNLKTRIIFMYHHLLKNSATSSSESYLAVSATSLSTSSNPARLPGRCRSMGRRSSRVAILDIRCLLGESRFPFIYETVRSKRPLTRLDPPSSLLPLIPSSLPSPLGSDRTKEFQELGT